MSFDIGRVFSNTFAMVKERWGPMLGLWATFFGALLLYAMVFGGVLGGSAVAMGAAFSGSLDNPAALGGMGIGFILMMVVFYIGYIAIALGQQGAMIAMASPIQNVTFGEAFTLGLKGGLSFLGVIVLLMIAYVVVLLLGAGLAAILGEAGAVILAILILPVAIYLACRMSVLVPVIVVDRVFNPIKAITQTWATTRGNVLGIFLIYVGFTVLALIAIGIPFALLGGMMGAGGEPGVLTMVFGFLIMIAIFIGFTLVSSSMIASLHAEISDTHVEDLSETFE
ncbi:hypothetical protein [uncultured Erythrobacter sp.]|uniref:hypothetical protein n=1 Tax=uncultured Erythrobacter sp. TaxID=263913 RepID=UPI002618A288|nr:hypothetical protein [uncultured Erythrobacter sp.]